MKVEGEGSGSHEGMAEMMASPSGGGPGKFVRRLNAVEAELNVYKVKCTSLEKNYESLIAWKNKMDVWLLDSFGNNIKLSIYDKRVVFDLNGVGLFIFRFGN